MRLIAGLLYLKHAYDLSDEAVCERWLENPYWQFFTGEVVFQTRLPCDASSLTRWRQLAGAPSGSPRRRQPGRLPRQARWCLVGLRPVLL